MGVGEAGKYVVGLEVRVCSHDLVFRPSLRKQTKNELDGDARTLAKVLKL